jgi:hypothetical protein
MITFFAIFANFRRKKLAFFSKTNVIITFLQKLRVVWTNNAKFVAKFFGENFLKIITSVPGDKMGEKLQQWRT